MIISWLKNEYGIVADKYIFVSFIFLYEVGHWNQLQDDGWILHTFLERDLMDEKNNHDSKCEIVNCALRRNGKYVLGYGLKLTSKEKEKLRKLNEEYRNIPKEADADKYAVKMLESLDLSDFYQEISDRRY